VNEIPVFSRDRREDDARTAEATAVAEDAIAAIDRSALRFERRGSLGGGGFKRAARTRSEITRGEADELGRARGDRARTRTPKVSVVRATCGAIRAASTRITLFKTAARCVRRYFRARWALRTAAFYIHPYLGFNT
jgi:hypothetical protein